MKKLICIVLMSWLPLFMAAANAMSMQMVFANQQTSSESTGAQVTNLSTSSMPCHKTGSKQKACSVCGFCMIASGIANYYATPVFQAAQFSSAKPAIFVTTFHSQSYPPAIKPPILN